MEHKESKESEEEYKVEKPKVLRREPSRANRLYAASVAASKLPSLPVSMPVIPRNPTPKEARNAEAALSPEDKKALEEMEYKLWIGTHNQGTVQYIQNRPRHKTISRGGRKQRKQRKQRNRRTHKK